MYTEREDGVGSSWRGIVSLRGQIDRVDLQPVRGALGALRVQVGRDTVP